MAIHLTVGAGTSFGERRAEGERYFMSDVDLFLSHNGGFSENNGFAVYTHENTLFSGSSPYFVDVQVLGSERIEGEEERDGIISHRVREEDTLETIAEEFGISKETIKWANEVTEESLSEGDELLILPTSGVLYYVKKDDTLNNIAQAHEADRDEIIAFNDIDSASDIRPGDQLMIPGGKKPKEPEPQQQQPVPQRRDQFVFPARGTVTQGDEPGHEGAVDIANSCGVPIFSISSGTVTDTGYDSRAGNYIWVEHGGMKALYGHLQTISVSPGDRVSAGQQIATMGNTGYTIGATGCHIHFETRGTRNPFHYLQRGDTTY